MKNAMALLIFIFIATGCSNTQETATVAPSNQNAALKNCPEERPQICTKIYKPVCATRDTGIRCVKAPCPSTENKTYGNNCTACADAKVIGYIDGACPEQKEQD